MIEAGSFVAAAHERGFKLFAGVSCSYLTPFINYVISAESLHDVGAVNEGDAVAIAAGADLGIPNDYETDCLIAASKTCPVYCTLVPDLVWAEIDDTVHLERAQRPIYPEFLKRDGASS